MPLAFRIEEFSLAVGDVRAFLHAHGERFLVRFQDLHLKVVVKLLVLVLPSVRAHQVLVEGRFFSSFGSLAVEFGHMLFAAAMCILPRLAVVAGCLFIAFLIGWHSSPEAEPAGYSITDRVPPAINLVLGISARNALWIITSIALEWIIVDQRLLEGTTSCLDDLDRPTLPAAHSGLLLLSLHPLLQF